MTVLRWRGLARKYEACWQKTVDRHPRQRRSASAITPRGGVPSDKRPALDPNLRQGWPLKSATQLLQTLRDIENQLFCVGVADDLDSNRQAV
jgi:hypothetical protein